MYTLAANNAGATSSRMVWREYTATDQFGDSWAEMARWGG
ncbi:RTA1 protein [Pyrenophora tritici-repentis]|nr:RTA1 protein [Pyrenophora tritici-repentis]